MALNSGIKTHQILTNDDEVCIPSLSSILLAVLVPGGFSHRINWNNYNLNWKEILGFRNMQEKLEISLIQKCSRLNQVCNCFLAKAGLFLNIYLCAEK